MSLRPNLRVKYAPNPHERPDRVPPRAIADGIKCIRCRGCLKVKATPVTWMHPYCPSCLAKLRERRAHD